MIQALLFLKDKWKFSDVLKYLEKNKINYISHRITKNYFRMRLVEPDYRKYIYRIERSFKGNSNIDYIVGLKK